MHTPDQCAILIGGLGTRLGELTRSTPKPLLPIGGRPFLDYVISEAIRFGLRDIHLLAGYRDDMVRRYLDERSWSSQRDVRISLHVETEPAGTGGALSRIRDHLGEHFFVLNGDSWFDFNWLALAQIHGAADAAGVLALRPATRPGRYGVAKLKGSIVQSFDVSSNSENVGYINGGVYLLSRSIFSHLQASCSLERDVFPRLARLGALRAGVFPNRFIDIGVPDDFDRAQKSVPSWPRRPAVFLDRDGTLNLDSGHVHRAADFRWLPGAIDAVKILNDAGAYVFVVTNQAGVAHGMYEESDVIALHDWVQSQLRDSAAHVDDFRFCPFHSNASVERYRREHPWRKPNPGMLSDLIAHWPVDRSRSVVLGDKDSDIEAGQALEIRGIKLTTEGILHATIEALEHMRIMEPCVVKPDVGPVS